MYKFSILTRFDLGRKIGNWNISIFDGSQPHATNVKKILLKMCHRYQKMLKCESQP